MTGIDKIKDWLALYNQGLGVTDSPTRGLMGELLFRDLMPANIQRRLVKGTFELESHRKVDASGQSSRKSKFQYDWLLLKENVTKLATLNISQIPFGFFDKNDVSAVIEIKAGDYLGARHIQTDKFAKGQSDRAFGLPWIYVTFAESGKTFLSRKDLDLKHVKANKGNYFCLSGAGVDEDNKAGTIFENMKEVANYLQSL